MHMIDLHLDAHRLVAHAQASDHNRADDEDLGYAVHAWLHAVFGTTAPSCFRLSERPSGALRLLGYSMSDAEAMRSHAESFAEPDAFAVCDWARMAGKSLDDVPVYEGRAFGFEVRVCPVKRGRDGERDAYLHAVEAAPEGASPDRARVYTDWLQERLCGAGDVEVERTEMTSFRLVSTWRRRHDHRGRAGKGKRLVRPDALMRGGLTVRDPDRFRALLGRGVGRHRAFGFGMLLLRPM